MRDRVPAGDKTAANENSAFTRRTSQEAADVV